MVNTEFDNYIAEEIAKYKGVAFPLKSGPLRRKFIKTAKCKHLHPNPDDEFSMPEIGPNYSIIGQYEKMMINGNLYEDPRDIFKDDPLVVERMYPDGYMIINGHHRWAATVKLKLPKIAISIVNLTHEADIEKMLENGKNSRRITLDLDEVVFAQEGDTDLEKELPFPLNKKYKIRLRSGIPALFNFFTAHGYDIWVYSSKYYSMDHLTAMFKRYHAKVTGVVTGTARPKSDAKESSMQNIKNLIAQKYKYTLHIDKDLVLQTFSGTNEFNEFEINTQNSNWSNEIMRIVGEMIPNE